MDDDQLGWVRSTEAEAEKSLNGYMAFIRKQRQGSAEFGYKLAHDERATYHTGFDLAKADDPVPDS